MSTAVAVAEHSMSSALHKSDGEGKGSVSGVAHSDNGSSKTARYGWRDILGLYCWCCLIAFSSAPAE